MSARLPPILDAPHLTGPDSRPVHVVRSEVARRGRTPRVLTLAELVAKLSRGQTVHIEPPAAFSSNNSSGMATCSSTGAIACMLLLSLEALSDAPHCHARAPLPSDG